MSLSLSVTHTAVWLLLVRSSCVPKGLFELSSFQSFSPQVLTNETVLGQEKKVDISSPLSSSILCHETELSTRTEAIQQLVRHVFFIYREGENNVSESVIFFYSVCASKSCWDTNTGNKGVRSGWLSGDLAAIVLNAAHFLNYMEWG